MVRVPLMELKHMLDNLTHRIKEMETLEAKSSNSSSSSKTSTTTTTTTSTTSTTNTAPALTPTISNSPVETMDVS